MKTSELIGPALDWAVEFVEGKCKAEPHANYWLEKWVDPERRYLCESASTCWAQGGPIIEREGISLRRCEEDEVDPEDVGSWVASGPGNNLHGYNDESILSFGPTPLIAAMRCYVASKLGDEVKIPKELE